MSRRGSRLRQAIVAGMQPGADLAELLGKLGDQSVKTRDEAQAICDALRQFPRDENAEWPMKSELSALVSLFQDVETREAFDELCRLGLPELCRIFDQGLDVASGESIHDLMMILKILAMYRTELGTQRVIRAARRPLDPDGFLWAIILGQYDHDHPHCVELLEELSHPLPEGFIAVALLDCANQCAIAGVPLDHPFNSRVGKQRLRDWLSSSDESMFSYAHSATASLPFIDGPERNDLLALALDHPNTGVQMEGAWASASLGNEGGVKLLARLCLDPHHSQAARRYLEELGRSDAVPSAAQEPDFVALADMCQWLAHPQEFGRPPDQIELFDTRTIYWPPTDDRRQVWLFRYLYWAEEPGQEDDAGLGMVGSVTFALFGEATADKTPLEAYALHCCWELEMNGDSRAPAQRTVDSGRHILLQYNPDWTN